MRLKIKNRSQRYDINRPRSRHGHKYAKYKICLSITMVICIKLYLSNIWSSIHEKVKEHWGWVQRKRCLHKKRALKMLRIHHWSPRSVMASMSVYLKGIKFREFTIFDLFCEILYPRKVSKPQFCVPLNSFLRLARNPYCNISVFYLLNQVLMFILRFLKLNERLNKILLSLLCRVQTSWYSLKYYVIILR